MADETDSPALEARDRAAGEQSLLEAMDDAICVFERMQVRPDGLRDYRYISMNRAMQTMFGIPDLSGQSIRDSFPDEAEVWYDDYDRVLETGQSMRIERRSEPRGNFLEMFVARIDDRPSNRLLAVIRDVTERKRSEEVLRESEERKAYLLKLADAIRDLRDPVEIKKAACRVLGEHLDVSAVQFSELDFDRRVIRNVRDYFRRDERSRVGEFPMDQFPAHVAAWEAGRAISVENVQTDATLSQGERAGMLAESVVAAISIPLLREDRAVAVMSALHDEPRAWKATDKAFLEDTANRTWDAVKRARAELAQREIEERFRALVNATSEVVYRMSADWTVMHELDGRGFIRDTTGPSRTWLEEYIAPEDQPEVLAAIARAIRTKSVFQLEHRVLREDGTLGWTFSRAIPILDRDGEIVEWFGAASDVTERHAVGETLAHAQRLEAVGRLAGAIAHDFNNLLQVIHANIELAGFAKDTSDRERYLDTALRAAELGESLNNRLVVWAGGAERRPKTLSLNDLVADTGSILERVLGDRVAVRRTLARDLWPINADPAEIDSALLNLIVNAQEAMPEGGTISLVTENKILDAEAAGDLGGAPGAYVCVSVTDTGDGMDEAVLRRAMEPLYSTKEKGLGTGLGLFSVNTIVRLSGGFVDIRSAPGKGTCVQICFPKVDENGEAAAVEENEGVQAPPASLTRVLVVEDREDVRRAAREQIEMLGYSVVEAGDAEQALERLQADGGIGLVLSDIVLPSRWSGRDLARHIRANLPGVGVVLASGFNSEKHMHDPDDLVAGVTVLRKPYRLRDLERALAAAAVTND